MGKVIGGLLIVGGIVGYLALGWVAGVATLTLAQEDEKAKAEGYESCWDKRNKDENTN